MAIAATAVWEVRSTGNDSNGGGFDPAKTGTDYSQQVAAQQSGVNLTVDATTNTQVIPDGYVPNATTDPGNIIQITTTGAGAAFTVGFYEIVSVTGVKWVLDRSPAAVSSLGAHGSMGGALATVGTACGINAGAGIYVKNGTYEFTSSNNASGGRFTTPTSGANSAEFFVIGYSSTRTPANTGTKPVFQPANGTNNIAVCTPSQITVIRNIDFENAHASTGCTAINAGNQYVNIEHCLIVGYKTGIQGNSGLMATVNDVSVTMSNENNAIGIDSIGYCQVCGVTVKGGNGSQQTGIVIYYYTTLTNVLVYSVGNNSDGKSTGIYMNGRNLSVRNVTVDGVYGNGIDIAATATDVALIDALVTNTTSSQANNGYGIYGHGLCDSFRIINCAGYNNTTNGDYPSANVTTLSLRGFVSLSADPYVNRSSADFTPNSVTGGGAALKSAAFPTSYPGVGTSNYQYIGAITPQPSHGGPANSGN
jgi:hypothetical protein